MGMIMKDGVPYGGVYPIDDVPTQGSDNTVKSGGVFSSLSNKVDKVAGKGLSTNDYSDTEKGKVADNTSAIEAITDVYSAKNLIPFDWNILKSMNPDGTWSGNVYTVGNSTVTVNDDHTYTVNGSFSTQTFFNLYTGKDFGNISIGTYDGAPATANGYTMSDGIQTPSPTNYGVGYSKDNTNIFIIFFAGASVSNLTIKPMIRDARITDPTYVPYAMTNRELTDAVNRGSVSVAGDGVKTMSQLFDELFSKINNEKVSNSSVIYSSNDVIYRLYQKKTTEYTYSAERVSLTSGVYFETLELRSSGSSYGMYNNGATSDISSHVSGMSYTLYY